LHDVHVKAVVDAAMQQEKARAEELQALEMDMDVDELKRALKKERAHSSRLAVDLATLRSAAVQSQADAEVHEEGRINGLMRRLEGLQQEKGRIIFELEREEEMVRSDYRIQCVLSCYNHQSHDPNKYHAEFLVRSIAMCIIMRYVYS
jgi:hypothetical protein